MRRCNVAAIRSAGKVCPPGPAYARSDGDDGVLTPPRDANHSRLFLSRKMHEEGSTATSCTRRLTSVSPPVSQALCDDVFGSSAEARIVFWLGVA